MGIKHLNRFLMDNCQDNIRQVSLNELRNKTIAVDISIYIYRFKAEQCLIIGINQMVELFRHNGVIPIFVFDGKPPPEKNDVLQKRREEKRAAEKQYMIAIQRLRECEPHENTVDLKFEIDRLRRKFIRITIDDINNVKKLLRLMGAAYYDSPGESDGICVRLVQQKVAYACLSEDMDMFAYGCPRVLRYINVMRGTAVLYDMEGIINTLKVPKRDFLRICILAGTDYNSNIDQYVDLHKAIKFYSRFRKDAKSTDFFKWLSDNLKTIDIETLEKCEKLFDATKIKLSHNQLTHTNYDKYGIRTYLGELGFVCV